MRIDTYGMEDRHIGNLKSVHIRQSEMEGGDVREENTPASDFSVARQIGMVSYRTPGGYEAMFGRQINRCRGGVGVLKTAAATTNDDAVVVDRGTAYPQRQGRKLAGKILSQK